MTSLLPLAYGYLREDLLCELDTLSSEYILRGAAESFGYSLGTIFHEPAYTGTLPPAFVELIQECRRAQAFSVLTFRGHLSSMSACQIALVSALAACGNSAIREIDPHDADTFRVESGTRTASARTRSGTEMWPSPVTGCVTISETSCRGGAGFHD